MQLLRYVLGALAGVGLLASAVVHAVAVVGYVPPMWTKSLHVACFVVFVLAAVASGRRESSEPPRVHWLVKVLIAYTVANLVWFLSQGEGGGDGYLSGSRPDGTYYLRRQGSGDDRYVRDITQDVYQQRQARIFRGFSGHWMLFFTLALVFLLEAIGSRRGAAEPGAAADGGGRSAFCDV